MDYEVVNLKEQMVVGLTARTKNSDPYMGMVIGSLWNSFYQDGICASIPNKKNDKALGIYSDYESDANGAYNVTVACAVSIADKLPQNVLVKTIPAGKYAKFVVRGHMQHAVVEFWQKLWTMNLDRTFISDFEEYQDANIENATIHIYIGIR